MAYIVKLRETKTNANLAQTHIEVCMRLLASDPDVETLVGRILSGDIDLQPAFQRGEVWSRGKKQRLIDSILRDWHVPPIHVIENEQSKQQEVLDGQQRLTAIRDFVKNGFRIDGQTEPLDPRIQQLDGKTYNDLSSDWKRLFNRFPIRTFLLVDYKPSEPGELFFRLNQPTSLTSAEQRNAFFGPVRLQIKEMVTRLEYKGLNQDKLGFSNFRMAYDDTIARIALTIERGTLAEKITAKDLELLYRSEVGISNPTIDLTYLSLEQMVLAAQVTPQPVRFNKASLYSWALFAARRECRHIARNDIQHTADFLTFFQNLRRTREANPRSSVIVMLMSIFENRSASRVADVSSVVLRDAILWATYMYFLASIKADWSAGMHDLNAVLLDMSREERAGEDYLLQRLTEIEWPRIVPRIV